MRVYGLGSLEFGVINLGLVQGLGFRVWALGFGVASRPEGLTKLPREAALCFELALCPESPILIFRNIA